MHLCVCVAVIQGKNVYGELKKLKLDQLVGVVDLLEDKYGLKTLLQNPDFKGTMFAPNNRAFKGVTVDDLDVLASIVTYHVLPDKRVTTGKIPKHTKSWATAFAGHSLETDKNKRGTVKVIDEMNNVAKVGRRNKRADKAVIQVIDKILMPKL